MSNLTALFVVWLFVGVLFFGTPAAYFVYMKKRSSAAWNLNLDRNYMPSAAILIPVHNEEKLIQLKLENLSKVIYPPEKMEVIVANDSSTDGTLNQVSHYIANHQEAKISVFDSPMHIGKTGCLNHALK